MSETVLFQNNRVAGAPAPERREELRVLAAATGGTVVLFGWSDDLVQCRLREDPPLQPLVIPPLDCTAPLPGTEAALHVLLAWLRPDVLDRRLSRLERAPIAMRNHTLLALRLARVRRIGHDVFSGGVRGEVTSIAAPVRYGDGDAALALIAPSVYLEDLDLRTIAADLVLLSAGLGSASTPTASTP